MKKVVLGFLATLAVGGLIALAAEEQAGASKDSAAQAGAGGGRFAALGLTDEQRAKIAEIRKGVREQIQAVLTDDQKAKLQTLREKIGERLQELRPKLTDDQKAKIKEILQAAKAKAAAANTPEEKAKVFQTAKEELRGVLTDEQAQKIETLKGKLAGLRGLIQKWRARRGANDAAEEFSIFDS
jgi:Spy/CpxP family protein refolding chaperone